MAKILIVDSNKVYAGMIKNILSEQLKEADIDLASNKWELKRRTADHYDMVLADLSITMDEEEMRDELKKMPDATIIVWSMFDKLAGNTVKKPSSRFELKEVISTMFSNDGRLFSAAI
jgi:CheY-like chemotaxis protein